MSDFKVIQRVSHRGEPDTRWVIVDSNDKLLDDASGYGYKTKQNALKAGWYKFQGGQKKIDEIKSWWKQNKAFSAKLMEFQELNFKEIYRDEVDYEEEVVNIAKEMNVSGFDVKFLKYM